jgi:hypothetical protein
MSKFKIENFCEEHNIEFKKYYNYLNNPIYLSIFVNYLQYINHNIIKKKIYTMIIKNHEYILERINKIDTLVEFYKKNTALKLMPIEFREDLEKLDSDHKDADFCQ